MADSKDFRTTFERLKRVLQKYEKRLTVTENHASSYSLDTPYSEKFKKPVFFGAVRINKTYVSFHLMPVYVFPDLLKGISPTLKKRMQGKSCFNFTTIDEEMLSELALLTQRVVEQVKKDKFLSGKS
jgi:hypothetical protein